MRSILVPLDGSALAERALPFAIDVARRTGARLELIVVSEPRAVLRGGDGTIGVDHPRDARLRDALQRYEDEVRARVAAEPGVRVDAEVLEGPAAATLSGYVRATRPDLLIVTTQGRAGGRRQWVGSVTDTLLRTVPSPVLVVPAYRDQTMLTPPIRGVLVALDGEPGGEISLQTAASIAGVQDVAYVIMSALAPLHPLVRTIAGEKEYERDLAEQRGILQQYLGGLADALQVQGAQVKVDVRVDANPAEAILDSADDHGVDLIALASHRRAPLSRLLLGSVADKVLRGSPVPILMSRLRYEGEEPADATASPTG